MILKGTTDVSFKRAALEKIGFTKASTGPTQKEGSYLKPAIRRFLMLASLALRSDRCGNGVRPRRQGLGRACLRVALRPDCRGNGEGIG